MYYQLYRAPPHFTRNVPQYLHEQFPDGSAVVVSRIGHHGHWISIL